MFTATVILVLIAIFSLILAFRGNDNWILLTVTALFIAIFTFLASAHWQISSSTLTGYIYQRNERFGFVDYDIRYSQNAGQDEQPSFCVLSGSDADKTIQKLVGTESKVYVNVPSNHFFVADNPYTCSSVATIERVENPKGEK